MTPLSIYIYNYIYIHVPPEVQALFILLREADSQLMGEEWAQVVVSTNQCLKQLKFVLVRSLPVKTDTCSSDASSLLVESVHKSLRPVGCWAPVACTFCD